MTLEQYGGLGLENYPHKLAGLYETEQDAERAASALRAAGLADKQVQRLPQPGTRDDKIEPESVGTRNRLMRDITAGTVAGGAVGTAGAAAVAGTTLLFAAAPVLGPLVIAGYGAMLGGVAGAVSGLRLREADLANLVNDATARGAHAVVVHARDEAERDLAQDVLDHSLAARTAQG
ncbi:hypothetical protein HUS23_03475 [Ectothiorhodospiraceae bacterium 2226]|nr:hypothetical protein HUS23_03475 [Ectothiorhodospiraceae bacterium 2226]